MRANGKVDTTSALDVSANLFSLTSEHLYDFLNGRIVILATKSWLLHGISTRIVKDIILINTRKKLAEVLGIREIDKKQNKLYNREVSRDKILGGWAF